MDDIQITDGETYTLSEVIEFVKQTLDRVSEKSTENPLRYSSTDVYWLLYDMIRYVNRNVPGEFILLQTQKGTYRMTYNDEDTARREARRKLRAEANRTARYLKELTGKEPLWRVEEEDE